MIHCAGFRLMSGSDAAVLLLLADLVGVVLEGIQCIIPDAEPVDDVVVSVLEEVVAGDGHFEQQRRHKRDREGDQTASVEEVVEMEIVFEAGPRPYLERKSIS